MKLFVPTINGVAPTCQAAQEQANRNPDGSRQQFMVSNIGPTRWVRKRQGRQQLGNLKNSAGKWYMTQSTTSKE